MTEIRTPPVEAVHRDSWHDLREHLTPGSVSFSPEPDSDGDQYMAWVCPCGCGHQSNLLVGNGFKPAESPSWRGNGSRDKPVLTPSIHRRGHWHGWLGGPSGEQPGVWVSC